MEATHITYKQPQWYGGTSACYIVCYALLFVYGLNIISGLTARSNTEIIYIIATTAQHQKTARLHTEKKEEEIERVYGASWSGYNKMSGIAVQWILGMAIRGQTVG